MKLKHLHLSTCPHCKIETELHQTMSGLQYQCENYHLCGFTIPIEKVTKEKDESP